MQFQTQVSISDSPFKIKYGDRVLSLGSCFSVHVADILTKLKYDVFQNPCGITFNPFSIFSCIKRCINGNSLLQEELIQSGNLWTHPDFHGSFNNISPNQVSNTIDKSISEAHGFIKSVDYVFITLGTAYVYNFLKTGKLVNNCHKLPADMFERKLQNVEDITQCLNDIITLLTNHSSKPVRFILALSPVRHIKDGLKENQKSKASCLIAIHNVCDQFENVQYFPSYEIILDELRDYRFYNEDMIHPTSTAIKYVF